MPSNRASEGVADANLAVAVPDVSSLGNQHAIHVVEAANKGSCNRRHAGGDKKRQD